MQVLFTSQFILSLLAQSSQTFMKQDALCLNPFFWIWYLMISFLEKKGGGGVFASHSQKKDADSMMAQQFLKNRENELINIFRYIIYKYIFQTCKTHQLYHLFPNLLQLLLSFSSSNNSNVFFERLYPKPSRQSPSPLATWCFISHLTCRLLAASAQATAILVLYFKSHLQIIGSISIGHCHLGSNHYFFLLLHQISPSTLVSTLKFLASNPDKLVTPDCV